MNKKVVIVASLLSIVILCSSPFWALYLKFPKQKDIWKGITLRDNFGEILSETFLNSLYPSNIGNYPELLRCGLCRNTESSTQSCQWFYSKYLAKLLKYGPKEGNLKRHMKGFVATVTFRWKYDKKTLERIFYAAIVDKDSIGISSLCLKHFDKRCNQLEENEIFMLIAYTIAPSIDSRPVAARNAFIDKVKRKVRQNCRTYKETSGVS